MSPCHRKVGWEAHAMAALPSLSQAVSSLLRASGPQLRDAGQESIPPPPPSYSDTMTTITTELPIRWPAWLLHASQTHRFEECSCWSRHCLPRACCARCQNS